MPYTEFTLELVESRFGLTVVPGPAFAESPPLPVPAWLADHLARGRAMTTLASEKARSAFLVAPLLLACRELVPGPLSLYSGQRLDVDAPLQLVGECDHILALTPPRAAPARPWCAYSKPSGARSKRASGSAPRRWSRRGCSTSAPPARGAPRVARFMGW